MLPPSADELRTDLEGAWKLKDIGSRVWGAAATAIAVYDANGLPRSLPAKRIGADDYLVPLHHLAAVLGPRALVQKAGGEARVTMMGKELVFRQGAGAMRADGREVALAQPMEFLEGQAIVPLSSVMQAVGRRVTWTQRDVVPIARLEPAP